MRDNSLGGRWISWSPSFLSLLRVIAAFLFIQFGAAKILGWPAAVMPGGGTAPLASQAGVAGLLELVAARSCSSDCSRGPSPS